MRESNRLVNLRTHFFANLERKIRILREKGEDVIRLDAGSPDMPPPIGVIEKLCDSARHPAHHGYQTHNGTPALRKAWSDMYLERWGVVVDPKTQVLPLIGSKEGIFHLSQAILNPGDIVLVPDPGYPTYTKAAQFAGAEVVRLRLKPENNFLPLLDSIPESIFRKAKLMWLNYPSNPTGAIGNIELFSRVVDYARRYDFLVCHDAAYSQITYSGKPASSILQVSSSYENVVEFNSLSKSHNMAGWRTAAVLGDERVIEFLYRLKTNVDSGHFLPVLDASIRAMKIAWSWIRERNEVYKKRRDLVVDGLHSCGFTPFIPGGGLYVWSSVPEGLGSLNFSMKLLDEAKVSVTPGNVFGDNGEGFFRVALVLPEEKLATAMQRLRGWMQT